MGQLSEVKCALVVEASMAESDFASARKAVGELLDGTGGRTQDDLKTWMEGHPEVLTAQGRLAIVWIEAAQIKPSAREDLKRLLELTDDCRTRGIEAGLRAFRSRHIARQQQERLLRDMERSRVERRTKAKVRFEELPPSIRNWHKPFGSLRECAEHLTQQFVAGNVSIKAKEIGKQSYDDRTFDWELPAYLFRGESGAYPESRSSADRLVTNIKLSSFTIEEILRVTFRVKDAFEKKWKLPSMLAEGFLQHYQLPTRYIDVTTDLAVALAFASDLPVGGMGAICALPADKLPQSGALIDLRGHPFAPRSHRQSALAFVDTSYRNLKSPEVINALGLHWFSFVFTETDEEEFLPRPELLDAHSDRAAGLAELAINSLGKFDDAAARWIANNLQPAPFVLRAGAGDSTKFEWISAEEAGLPYEQRDSRQENYRAWSNNIPAIEKRPLPEGLVQTLADVDFSPEAILQVFGPNVFGLLEPDFLNPA
jgi:FRG domain